MTGLISFGLALLAQSSCLLLLGLLASWLLKRRGPMLCAFVLQMTLAGVVLGAVLSVFAAGRVQPVWSVSVPTATHSEEPTTLLARSSLRGVLPKREDKEKLPNVPPPTPVAPAPSPSPALPGTGRVDRFAETGGVLLWALGTLCLLLRLLACQFQLARLRRRAMPLQDNAAAMELHRLCAAQGMTPPALLMAPGVGSPFLAGLRRPAIFLPLTWETDYDPPTLTVIFAHELAHLRRRDLLWTWLLRLTTAALWPQPLLWLLGRQLEQVTEEACDWLAVTLELPAKQYADCLLGLAERSRPSPLERALGAGVAPVRSSIGRRIQNILEWRNHAMYALSPRVRLAAALGIAFLSVAAVFFVSAFAAPVSNGNAIPNGQRQIAAQAVQMRQIRQKEAVTKNHLGHIALAILEYTQDNDERLPDAAHWVDEISPYLVSGRSSHAERQQALNVLMHDPFAPPGQTWSYAYNHALSHLPLAIIPAPAQVIEVFPSTLGTKNASDNGQSLPDPGWVGNGSYYAFMDGHVKWIRNGTSAGISFQPGYSSDPATQAARERAQTLMRLQSSLMQAQQECRVAKVSAAVLDSLAKKIGPTRIIRLPPAARPQVSQLRADIADMKAQIEVMSVGHPTTNPKIIQVKQSLRAREDELNNLVRQPYRAAEPNSDYQSLRQQADQERAQAARAQAISVSIREQIGDTRAITPKQ